MRSTAPDREKITMCNATGDEWTAALAAWDALDEGQRNIALGYLASEEPNLLHRAAAAAADRGAPGARRPPVTAPATTGAANSAVAHLDTRGRKDVLDFLALHEPDAVLLAVRETGA